MPRDERFDLVTTQHTTRRTIIRTGAKLVYAAPLVAATLRFTELGVHALDPSCTGLDPNFTWTFDPNVVPPGAPDTLPGFPGCCTCGPIAGATYYPSANFCCPAGYAPNPAIPLTCVDSSGIVTGFVQPLACLPITQTGPSSPA